MTEKELMLISLLNCRRIDLYTQSLKLSDAQEKQYAEMRRRRNQGEPLQYIIGFSDFFGYKIFLDDRVLIPRPETEILVEKALDFIKDYPEEGIRILDLGTGSGNIPIALLRNLKDCHVTAVDISEEALELALDNAKLHNVHERINFVCQDMTNFLKDAYEKKMQFDVIIANPPYIPSGQLQYLPAEVRKEPSLALDGGADGLVFYRAIIGFSRFLLGPKGAIFLEIGENQKDSIEYIFGQYKEFGPVTFVDDYVKIPRIVKGTIKESLWIN